MRMMDIDLRKKFNNFNFHTPAHYRETRLRQNSKATNTDDFYFENVIGKKVISGHTDHGGRN